MAGVTGMLTPPIQLVPFMVGPEVRVCTTLNFTFFLGAMRLIDDCTLSSPCRPLTPR